MDALVKAFFEGPDTVTFGEDVVFTDWPEAYPEHAKYINGMGCFRLLGYKLGKCICCCIPGFCRRRARVPWPKPAKVSLTITLSKVAEDFVVENEEVKPEEDPVGRVGWKTGMSSPGLLARTVVGHSNINSCTYVLATLCCIMCFVIVLVVLYFMLTIILEFENV